MQRKRSRKWTILLPMMTMTDHRKTVMVTAEQSIRIAQKVLMVGHSHGSGSMFICQHITAS
jgi:hypothetical protein